MGTLMNSCQFKDFFPDWKPIISAGLVIGSMLAQGRVIQWIGGVTKEGVLFSSLVNSLGLLGVIQLTRYYRIESKVCHAVNGLFSLAIRSYTPISRLPSPEPPPPLPLSQEPLQSLQPPLPLPPQPPTKWEKLQNEMRKPLYPQQFLTRVPKDPDTGKIKSNLLRDSGDNFKGIYDSITLLQDIKLESDFLAKGLYDIYDIQFQNLALRLTNSLSQEELFSLQWKGLFPALAYRARGVAISSRIDLDWSGKSIVTDQAKMDLKEAEIQTYYNSFVICNPNIEEIPIPPPLFTEPVKIKVVNKTTTAELLDLLDDPLNDPNEISSLILANRIMMGGGHQKIKGSQEETTGGDSGLFAILSTKCEFTTDGWESGRAVYQTGYALPPGGVSYCNTRLLDGTNGGKGRECSYLISGFADFRPHYPHSELEEYSEGGKLKIDDSYLKRIKLEMINTLRFAIYNKKPRLILGASGCGAFHHDVEVEAQAWKEVLYDYRYYFKEIIFAIFHHTTEPVFRRILDPLN